MSKANTNPPTLTPQDIERFHRLVDKTPGYGPKGDCWIWTLRCDEGGYGHFSVARGTRNCIAHRIAHFVATGTWSELLVCHSCDNPPCCRPDHLFSGTAKDNSDDKFTKHRDVSGDKHWSRRRPQLVKRGDSHNLAKLSEVDVLAIRALHRKKTYKQIAEMFGVQHSNINKIVNRKIWRHI